MVLTNWGVLPLCCWEVEELLGLGETSEPISLLLVSGVCDAGSCSALALSKLFSTTTLVGLPELESVFLPFCLLLGITTLLLAFLLVPWTSTGLLAPRLFVDDFEGFSLTFLFLALTL